MAGELVGINTAIYSCSGGSIGIGFAIPSNMVRAVIEAAKNGNDFFERPYIGATFEPVRRRSPKPSAWRCPPARCHRGHCRRAGGKAGLRPGDVLAVNGASIEHVDALGYRLRRSRRQRGPADVLSQNEKKTARDQLGARAGRRSGTERRSMAATHLPAPRSPSFSPAWPSGSAASEIKGVAIVDVARIAGGRFRLPAARHRARSQWRGDHDDRRARAGR